MVRHNNMIPHAHFRKNWQSYIKTWFDQPMKKIRRQKERTKKLRKSVPCPVNKLRPIVHCPTVRYNSKIKLGRGFTLKELRSAGLNYKFALTIGVAVDFRRKNKSYEILLRNVQRLKEYHSMLVVFPKSLKKYPTLPEGNKIAFKIEQIKQPLVKLHSKIPKEEEKKFKAFVTLRHARANEKYHGRRLKLKKLKEAGVDISKLDRKTRKPQEEPEC